MGPGGGTATPIQSRPRGVACAALRRSDQQPCSQCKVHALSCRAGILLKSSIFQLFELRSEKLVQMAGGVLSRRTKILLEHDAMHT
jgi:hypothetical protein